MGVYLCYSVGEVDDMQNTHSDILTGLAVLNAQLVQNLERSKQLCQLFYREYPWHPLHPGYTLQVTTEGGYQYLRWVAYSKGGKKPRYGRKYSKLPASFWTTRMSHTKRRFREYQTQASALQRERTALLAARSRIARILGSLPAPVDLQIDRPTSDERAQRKAKTRAHIVAKRAEATGMTPHEYEAHMNDKGPVDPTQLSHSNHHNR